MVKGFPPLLLKRWKLNVFCFSFVVFHSTIKSLFSVNLIRRYCCVRDMLASLKSLIYPLVYQIKIWVKQHNKRRKKKHLLNLLKRAARPLQKKTNLLFSFLFFLLLSCVHINYNWY